MYACPETELGSRLLGDRRERPKLHPFQHALSSVGSVGQAFHLYLLSSELEQQSSASPSRFDLSRELISEDSPKQCRLQRQFPLWLCVFPYSEQTSFSAQA